MHGVEVSGLAGTAIKWIGNLSVLSPAGQIAGLSLVSVVLSNVVSNVPAVMLLKPLTLSLGGSARRLRRATSRPGSAGSDGACQAMRPASCSASTVPRQAASGDAPPDFRQAWELSPESIGLPLPEAVDGPWGC